VGSVLTAGGGTKAGSAAGATVSGAAGGASWATANDELPMSAAMMAVFLAMRFDCALVIFNLLSVWTKAQRFVADNWSVLCGLRGVISVEPSRKSLYSFAVQRNQAERPVKLEAWPNDR
jgi:hypothetical protein